MSGDTYLRRRRFAGYDVEFLEWSRHMSYYFSQRDYNEVKQCNVAINCLTEYALDWWFREEEYRRYQGWQPIITWEQLVYVMAKHFAPSVEPEAYAARSYRRTRPRLESVPMHTPVRSSKSSPDCKPARVTMPFPSATVSPVVLVPTATTIAPIASALVPDSVVTPTIVPMEPEPTRLPLDVTSAPSSLVPKVLVVPPAVLVPMTTHESKAPATRPSVMTIISTTTCNSKEKIAPAVKPFMLIFEVPRVGLVPHADAMVWLILTRLFFLAPTCSKRGRFDSKGGRVMRSCLVLCRYMTSPRRPRPWRPPWART